MDGHEAENGFIHGLGKHEATEVKNNSNHVRRDHWNHSHFSRDFAWRRLPYNGDRANRVLRIRCCNGYADRQRDILHK